MDEIIKANHKYVFRIGEPWDYLHPKYGNNIPGTVLEANEEWVIFRCDEPLEYEDIQSNILILLAKHYDYRANNINSSYGAGMLFINDKHNRNVETKYAFIGCLKKY